MLFESLYGLGVKFFFEYVVFYLYDRGCVWYWMLWYLVNLGCLDIEYRGYNMINIRGKDFVFVCDLYYFCVVIDWMVVGNGFYNSCKCCLYG